MLRSVDWLQKRTLTSALCVDVKGIKVFGSDKNDPGLEIRSGG